MSNLPFLKIRKPASLRTQSGESMYGFSEHDEMCEQALQELMEAADSKDHSKLMEALEALIECLIAKHSGDDDAIDS